MRLLLSISILFLITQNLFAPKMVKFIDIKWPVNNPIVTQRFSDKHDGVDLISSSSREIKSASNCLVTQITKTENSTPKLVCENNLFEFHYLHIRTNLKQGDSIDSESPIGVYTNEGNSNGYHLHFIIRNKLTKEFLNPLIYLNDNKI